MKVVYKIFEVNDIFYYGDKAKLSASRDDNEYETMEKAIEAANELNHYGKLTVLPIIE